MQNSKYLFYVTYQYQFIKYIFLFFYALFLSKCVVKKGLAFLALKRGHTSKRPIFPKVQLDFTFDFNFTSKSTFCFKKHEIYARANQGKYMWILKANQRPDLRWCHFFIRNYRKLLRFPYIVTSHIRVRKMNTHVYCV